MANLRIHTALGDWLAQLVSAAEQGEEIWYQKSAAELHSLLPPDIRDDLRMRGLIVAPRDIGLLLARLKAARLKQEDLRLAVED